MLDIESLTKRKEKIDVVGLGYVGLPLLVHLAAHFEVVGFDIDRDRVAELASCRDRTREISSGELRRVPVHYASDPRGPG